ncbi:MAG: glycosyltransferase family 4 protein [Planctomycetes bacterium]|nr:glycosyltransferase family 4 protein [Planctomycetota bacterium]
MLNYEFPPIGGGAANAHRYLLQQYAGSSDLKVDVLTSAPKPGFFKETFTDNITIYKVGLHKKELHFWRKTEVIEWLFKARFHYRKLLRENDYDLAHAFFGFPTGWLCYRSANKLPYIISLRGSDVPGKNVRLKLDYKILAPVFRRIWKNAAALVACSQGLKDRALDFLPCASIDVIPNGVDLGRFGPAETPEKSETLRLLTVGRLSITKRVDMLIEAVEILHKDDLNVHLTILGSGALEQQLRQTISQKNLGDVVEMTGRIDPEEMPQLYRQSDILVSATMQEGMSNAMLEAMASGLPIITTRCEGTEELIADNGLVAEDANAEEIAKAIRILADDPQARKQMSIAARRRAEKFSWPNTAKQYILTYRPIACRKDNRPWN